MNKVIVTGGAGFIGSNLVERLLKDGAEEILIIDDFSTGKKENLHDSSKVHLVESKLEDINDLESQFKGYDFCFHLAAGVGVQYIMDNLSDSLLTNIQGTHIVFEACKENNIPVLITSTSEIYGTSKEESWDEETKSLIGPTTKLRWSYAVSKMIDEFLALSEFEAGNLKPIIVRLFNTIGPNQVSDYGMVVPRFVESALKDEDLVIHGDGSQTRSFTWVGDVVDGLLRSGLHEAAIGQEFNLAGGWEISTRRLAEKINSLAGNKAGIQFVSRRKWDSKKRVSASVEKARKLIGYAPEADFDWGLAQTVQWFRDNWEWINATATFGPGISSAVREIRGQVDGIEEGFHGS